MLTSSSEVYCFGLNAGQLGLANEIISGSTPSAINYNANICYIAEAKQVTTLNDPDLNICQIDCSDGCTICLQVSLIIELK